MARIAQRLTDKNIQNAQPKLKDYKLYDGEGLQLLIRATGKKVWQYPYKFRNKTTIYTIGEYKKNKPGSIGLAQARTIKHEVKNLLEQGTDPNEHKSLQRAVGELDTTFESLGLEWHSKGTWVPKHAKNILRSLENDVFSFIGNKQITEITRRDIVSILAKVEKREAYDVARRICQRCEAIFDYAMDKGVCDSNPASGRAKTVKSPRRKNRPHLKENQVGEFLVKLDDYHGKNYVRLAMKLLVLTFVRPGELRKARWEEFDLENALWSIPAKRMKMKRDHKVPLSKQAIAILEELRVVTGKGDFLFPGLRSPHKPISDVTLLKVLKIMGYVGNKKIVPHGFRHTASTILNEHQHNYDAIERQLSHVEKNSVRRAYNHAEYMEQRQTMMQWYADYLEGLMQTYLIKFGTNQN